MMPMDDCCSGSLDDPNVGLMEEYSETDNCNWSNDDIKKTDIGQMMSTIQLKKRRIFLLRVGVALVILAVAITTVFVVCLPLTRTDVTPSITFSKAAVAADDERCSIIGNQVLLDGGSAMDSAIACLLCLGVVNPQSAGLGGGNFITAYDRTTTNMIVFNGRESGPEAATRDMFLTASSVTGGMAIGVPGELASFRKAWQKMGKLPWKRLFQPSIDMIYEGVVIGAHLGAAINRSVENISKDVLLRSVFLNGDLTPKREGDVFQNVKLAESYTKLATSRDPVRLFYEGEMADKFVAEIQAHGGIISKSDFSKYRAKIEEPLSINFGDYRVYSSSAPSGGPIVLYILNVLKNYRLTSVYNDIHRLIEGLKFGYGARMGLGDPDFIKSVPGLVDQLLTPEYCLDTKLSINDSCTNSNVSFYIPEAVGSVSSHGTTHVSVLDELGNAASITSSINYYFGSAVASASSGIIFNNEMDDFSSPAAANLYGLSPSDRNYPAPGKRMQSSMSPTIVVDQSGDVKLVVGASGGAKIISSVALVILYCLEYDEDVDVAVLRKRFHHQLIPDTVLYEFGTDIDLVKLIEKYGHVTRELEPAGRFSVVQVIKRVAGAIQSISDPRKYGVAMGY